MHKFIAFFILISSSWALGQNPISSQPIPASLVSIPQYQSITNKYPMPSLSNYGALNQKTMADNQRRMADQDMANYQMRRAKHEQIIAEANAEFHSEELKNVHYDFPNYIGKGKKDYITAFNELKKMLEGQSTLDLKRAVYLVEHAYDTTLKLSEFNQQINDAVSIIGLKMKKDKIFPSDNTGKIMTAFKYMADTLQVYSTSREKNITSYPKTYDFEDFWGKTDYHKMFVSKVMRTGSGQCHSLPLLFLIICQEIKADASLSFSPNHSFVKFKDARGTWHNLELTNGMLASDQFMVQSGYVKAEAIQSKIYLAPISKKENIAQCFNDLAMGYAKKYGNDSFVTASTDLALKYYPSSLTAHQINANYYKSLGEFVVKQYQVRGWTRQKLYQDEKAMAIKRSGEAEFKKIEQLGYSDMPADAYEAWLKSIQTEAGRQQHNNEVKALNGMINRK